MQLHFFLAFAFLDRVPLAGLSTTLPLVAFDENLNRLGYGGGYYDRYIQKYKKNKKIITIGLGYSFQKVKKIPLGKNDMKLDFIITEKSK